MTWIAHYRRPIRKVSYHSLEIILLYLAIFFMPMKRGASFGWIGLPWELTFFKVFLGVAFALWVVKSIFTKNPQLFTSPFGSLLNIAIILFFLASIISVINSTDPSAALSTLFRRFILLLFYCFIINIIKNTKAFRYMIIVFLLGIGIECIAGIYELYSGEPVLNYKEVFKGSVRETEGLYQAEGKIRIQGFALDPDVHAYFMIIGTSIVLPVIFSNYIIKSKLSRFFFICLFIFMLINVLATSSRAGWIGFLISVSTFLLFAKIKKKALIITGTIFLSGVLLIVVGAFSNAPIFERLLGKTGGKSISLRMDEAKTHMAMFRSHPILGVGTGNSLNTRHRYSKVAYVPIDANSNGYLTILSENGLMGFVAYLLILYSSILIPIRIIASGCDPDEKNMSLGFLSAYFSHLFLLYFYCATDIEFLWFSIGMGTVMYWMNKEKVEGKSLSFSSSCTISYPKSNKAESKSFK